MTLVLRFVHQQHEAENATSFFFQPESPLTFRAGQYLRYTLPHSDPDTRGISRFFSIASSPDEPLLRLTTRLSTPPSTFKQALARLRPGAIVDASGPFGQFVYAESSVPPVLIAGGIGITPMRSILGDLASRRVRIRSTLLYSSASPEIPFRTWLDGMAEDWPELRVIYTVTRQAPEWKGPTGRIDAAFIKRHVPDVAASLCMVAGPTPLVEAMRAALADVGVDNNQVKYEAFPGYDRELHNSIAYSGGSGMSSFAQDIRPLFRDRDVQEMRFAFDLSQYDEVKAHAQGIYDRLADGSMPCDGAWAEDRIAMFRQWMDAGYSP